MTHAIVFDLDETLYPERRFALSGFAAVAHEVERAFGVRSRDVFSLLVRETTRGRRQFALQALCRRFGLPPGLVEEMRWRIRTHSPNLKLPKATAHVLSELRSDWRIGILTNGLPAQQERKIAALGLADKVDAIVYAEQTGPGKPDLTAFDAIVRRLDIRACDTIFVGDDPWRDVFGARRAGMKAVWLLRESRYAPRALVRAIGADAVVDSLRSVPDCARRLVGSSQSTEDGIHAAYC